MFTNFDLNLTVFGAKNEAEATEIYNKNSVFNFDNNIFPVWLDAEGVIRFPNEPEMGGEFFWSEKFIIPNNLKEFDFS